MNLLKKGISLLLALIMVVSLLPMQTHAATNHSCSVGGETVTWTAWTSANSLPTSAGNYYLTKNVTVSSRYSFPDGIILCLNGYTVNGIGGIVASPSP